ncbi:MAG: DoxX family protein [Verrucomicrobiales bacterium]
MTVFQITCQIIISLGILNVWLLRGKRATPYRGSNASNLKEEFAAYGLPPYAVWVIGTIKVGAAIALLVGIFVPAVAQPAAIVIAVLMASAVAMHAKVKDPLRCYLPATAMLLLSLAVIFTERS